MSDRPPVIRQQPAKDGQLLPYRFRPNSSRGHPQEYLPELSIVTGRDSRSSGMYAYALLPVGGLHPSPVTLVDARWQSPILSLEELVVVTIKGLEAYCREAGYGLPPR